MRLRVHEQYSRIEMARFLLTRNALLVALALVLGNLSWSVRANPASEPASAGELRAAATIGVLRFTSWPAGSPAPSDELGVCLSGQPDGEAFLLPASGAVVIGNKPLRVQALAKDDWAHCGVFVVGGGTSLAEFIALAQHAEVNGVLTVCDGCIDSARELAMITLNMEEARVAFNVNLQKAIAANVRLDASLLELAARVTK